MHIKVIRDIDLKKAKNYMKTILFLIYYNNLNFFYYALKLRLEH